MRGGHFLCIVKNIQWCRLKTLFTCPGTALVGHVVVELLFEALQRRCCNHLTRQGVPDWDVTWKESMAVLEHVTLILLELVAMVAPCPGVSSCW